MSALVHDDIHVGFSCEFSISISQLYEVTSHQSEMGPVLTRCPGLIVTHFSAHNHDDKGYAKTI